MDKEKAAAWCALAPKVDRIGALRLEPGAGAVLVSKTVRHGEFVVHSVQVEGVPNM